ncbi:MAG TPA: L-histidine N(alpha)-methyltransferase [Myxococcales bacterium]|jgi:L-histidine Nalpha-methyltransferase|nr:L-histidine N(alpha)-methyltransferase [Myxococcales bacterium]
MARRNAPEGTRAATRRPSGEAWRELLGTARPARHVRPEAVTLSAIDAEEVALAELRDSLSRTPRELPSKYFYDDRGSALFEKITTLPEYYPTRTERALLNARAPEIVLACGGSRLSDVVELGSGAASKTLSLLSTALSLGGHPRYVAVDISAHALRRTRELLAEGLAGQPPVPVHEVLADYTRTLRLPPRITVGAQRLALFLGGTIGNDEDEAAIALLSRVREQLDPGDAFLLGANLVCEPAAIHAAYNDAAGVTAQFNANILNAVNAIAKSAFDPSAFDHHAPYVVEHSRVEMWLVARQVLEIDLGRLGGTLRMDKGEGIRTEISRRFTRASALRLLDASGFSPEHWMESPDARFGLALGKARTGLRSF